MAARSQWTRDCGVEGCRRARYVGDLCRAHYQLVPRERRLDCAVDCMRASHAAAQRHHRAQLEYVQQLEHAAFAGS